LPLPPPEQAGCPLFRLLTALIYQAEQVATESGEGFAPLFRLISPRV
jgi:hypothetical protein